MKNKAVWFTLFSCSALVCAYLLMSYKLAGGNPANRMGYAIFISLTPALVALAWTWLKGRTWTAWRSAEVYFLLLFATVFVQGWGRMIPVYQIIQSLKP